MYPTQYSTLNEYLMTYYIKNSQLPITSQILAVVWALNYYQCVGPYAEPFEATFTTVCPSGLDTYNSFLCWENWDVVNQTGCVSIEYCDWNPSITDPVECEAASAYVEGFCIDTLTGNVLSEGPACLFSSSALNVSSCTQLNGTWLSFEDGYCIDESATNSTECLDPSFLEWGTDSFTANLASISFCYNKSITEEEECNSTWVPTLQECINTASDYENCISSGLEYHSGKIWLDQLATESACNAGICSDMETFSQSTCDNTFYCDLACEICGGGSICYSDNLTIAECTLLAGYL